MGTLRLRRTSQVLLAAIALSALPRLLLLPVNEHLYGDAIPRTELAEQWARSPHVITAFGDGAMQFGPLHLYLIAAALPWFDRADAARVLSLVFGLLAAPILFVLARRLFGWRAAVVAVAGLAVWGLHIQFSTTGGSEALSLCLTLAALAAFAAGLDSRRTRDFAAAGICLTLACAVRYDPWVYVVLLPASVVLTRRRGGALPVAGVAAFVATAVSFPVFWMVGNHLMHGQALYPFTFIDVEHARLASLEAGGWREAWLRFQGMTFWPAMLVVSLTPGVGLLAAAGLVRAWRTRADTRWLIVTVYMPLVYYAVRTTILFDFVPLVRFLAVPLAVALIFVREGYLELAGRWGGAPGASSRRCGGRARRGHARGHRRHDVPRRWTRGRRPAIDQPRVDESPGAHDRRSRPSGGGAAGERAGGRRQRRAVSRYHGGVLQPVGRAGGRAGPLARVRRPVRPETGDAGAALRGRDARRPARRGLGRAVSGHPGHSVLGGGGRPAADAPLPASGRVRW